MYLFYICFLCKNNSQIKHIKLYLSDIFIDINEKALYRHHQSQPKYGSKKNRVIHAIDFLKTIEALCSIYYCYCENVYCVCAIIYIKKDFFFVFFVFFVL